MGVLANVIIKEGHSKTTLENVKFTKEMRIIKMLK